MTFNEFTQDLQNKQAVIVCVRPVFNVSRFNLLPLQI